MEIPLNAHVFCGSELCGHSRFVVIEPRTHQLTHFVVKTINLIDPIELVVPIEWVEKACCHSILLNHTHPELLELPQLESLDTLAIWDPELGYFPQHAVLWPISLARFPRAQFNIPRGEELLEQGSEIRAADGRRIGWVDEFVIDPHSGEITHLVMREGHFWHPKIVSVPVRFIHKIEKEIIYLSLDELAAEQLPEAEKSLEPVSF
jgi:sporulation protein YlmC with PRC-barrel domain